MSLLLNKFIKINSLYLLGIFRREEGSVYSLLKVKRSKDQLSVLETYSFTDFEILVNKLDKKVPVLIVLDGKGVLNKKINLKNNEDTDWLKNLDYNAIYFTSYKTEEVEFLSFCRKNVVVDCIEILEKEGIQLLDIYIGPLVSVLIKNIVKETAICSNLTLLQFKEDSLDDIVKSETQETSISYQIGDSILTGFQVPLYAAAINFYVNAKEINKSKIEKISAEEILYRRAFEKLGVFTLGLFFVLLLTSYFLIQYYISENASLNLENSYSNKSYDLIKKLDLKKKQKLKILKETGFSSKRFLSYYSNELSKSVPVEVDFSIMDIYPLLKEVKKSDKIVFDYRIIKLEGKTSNKDVFNSWIDELKNKKWIKALEIVSIKRDKKDITYFELKITTSDV